MTFEEEQSFHVELRCRWDMNSSGDLVMCFGDLSGLVGRHIDVFDAFHGGLGVGQRNL